MAKAEKKVKRKKKAGLTMKTWAQEITAEDVSLRQLNIVQVQKVLKHATKKMVGSPKHLRLALSNGIRLNKVK